jgi:FMN phosphatase YigB (HAD superfamily)
MSCHSSIASASDFADRPRFGFEEPAMPVLKAIFFDIGGTLGTVEPGSLKLHLFPDSVSILGGARAMGLRLGVITNVPDEVDEDRVRQMLAEAQVGHFFEEGTVITSTDAGSFKPTTAIYLHAAAAMKLPVDCCIYADQNPVQVAGAVAAGMQGMRLRPARSPVGL